MAWFDQEWAHTSTQNYARLVAMAMGLIGGLCHTDWSRVVGMNWGASQVGECVVHTEYLA